MPRSLPHLQWPKRFGENVSPAPVLLSQLVTDTAALNALAVSELRELQHSVDERIETEMDRGNIAVLNRCWWLLYFIIKEKYEAASGRAA